MPTKDINPLFVRMTEAEKRRVRTLAVSQGLTLRQAILQAFDAWVEKLESGGASFLDPRPGARADDRFGKADRPNRGPQRSAQRQGANPSASSGQAPSTGSGQAPSTSSGQPPSAGSGQAPSTGSGQAPSASSGQAPGHRTTPKQDRRRTEAGPSATSGGGQPANPQAAPVRWLRRAAQLDWSKCPAVESVPGKRGVWVVRGTRVRLDSIFYALDHGQPPEEVLEASDLTREQFMAVLQFVAESVGVFPADR